jgi:hypothetical protein
MDESRTTKVRASVLTLGVCGNCGQRRPGGDSLQLEPHHAAHHAAHGEHTQKLSYPCGNRPLSMVVAMCARILGRLTSLTSPESWSSLRHACNVNQAWVCNQSGDEPE